MNIKKFQKLNEKIFFLNSDVEKEALDDFTLYIAYRLMFDSYDEDIDPIHNPEYLKKQQEIEIVKLNDIKTKINQLKRDFDKKLIEKSKKYNL
jgi:hypothetical protein